MTAPTANQLPIDQTQSHAQRFETLAKVATRAEKLALEFFSRRSELLRLNKSHTDFVTEADRAVENCIRSAIAEFYPDDTVVGEEMGGEITSSYWLVDPIDGTSNFLSGLPLWSISIAYIEDHHPVLGAVSMPMLGRCLLGGRGFDLQEIRGQTINAGGASLVFGIGRNEHWARDRRDLIEDCIKSEGLTGVSLGSCATSLALAASGELAGYAEGNVGFWDIAAGIALCEAAQVPISFFANGQTNSSFVVAGPSTIQPDVFAITNWGEKRSNEG